ncbi:hypothetical protein [Kamptonema sp. UHCC 0994]|uniref:hypothetical protein n=1 Tax=Kamptonema sp. UHCC 0994 TaxID=3031329 RepID=UPI0023B89C32|nr:hypothetical protein [Kamptonema sp. UHCC 0994]MDF0553370.1 hypothetical protein [Kamptonema sp. UHCC 0994]
MTPSSVSRHIHDGSREHQYECLRSQTDPNSQFECIVLQEIYQRGMKLPDAVHNAIASNYSS